MTHNFSSTAPGHYSDQHGCRLIDDGQQVRLYWRTRYDAHLYRGTLAAFLAAGEPVTVELGGSQRPEESVGS